MIHKVKINVQLWVCYKKIVNVSFMTINKSYKIYIHTYERKREMGLGEARGMCRDRNEWTRMTDRIV